MVSVIMPAYNRAYVIERAVKSVMRQTCQDWELIIVDDASEDHTEEIIKPYLSDQVRYYRNRTNQGANMSRNIGVRHAAGEYLAFLDSDNYWPENRLELQMGRMREYKDQNCFLYGKTQVIDDGEVFLFPEKVLTAEELKKTELRRNVVDLNTVLLKKSLFIEAGEFEPRLPRFQDWELVLRLLYVVQAEGIGCEECLSFNEIQEDSIGRDSAKLIEAVRYLYDRYLRHYLNQKELVRDLAGLFQHKKEGEEERWKELMTDISSEEPEYLFTAMEHLYRRGCELQNSRRMEKMLYEWHRKNQNSREGTLFSEYFYEGSKVKTIAVYGLGKLGELFYHEVKQLPVEVKYGIDQEKQEFEALPVKCPGEELEPVDWIIVTMIKDSGLVKKSLAESYRGTIVTLEEIIRGNQLR